MQFTKAQESRAAIERLYIVMRHLFNRGYYKPFGKSGSAIRDALLTLSPEIYGTITDSRKVELEGLVYVMDRLPKGIEECRIIKLVSEEGYDSSSFEKIVPAARRRNCYRVDKEQMLIEVTRGRSEIYDILTHLTFMYIEAEKIKNHVLSDKGQPIRDWLMLEKIVQAGDDTINENNKEIAFSYLSTILGRTFEETKNSYERFNKNATKNNGLFHIVYWLGKRAIEETLEQKAREINFTPILRERIGHHIYGERWANRIKKYLYNGDMIDRPIHIISANLHSVMNSLYATAALGKSFTANKKVEEIALDLSKPENKGLNEKVLQYAENYGMNVLDEKAGTQLSVQIFDTSKIKTDKLPDELPCDKIGRAHV